MPSLYQLRIYPQISLSVHANYTYLTDFPSRLTFPLKLFILLHHKLKLEKYLLCLAKLPGSEGSAILLLRHCSSDT